MHCLNIQQPHASLLIDGLKTVECRSYSPPEHLIGKRIAIRATTYSKYWAIDEIEFYTKIPQEYKDCIVKSILGTVILDSYKKYSGVQEFRDDILNNRNLLQWYSSGIYGWIVRDPIKFNKPINCKNNPGGIVWGKDVESKVDGLLEALNGQ